MLINEHRREILKRFLFKLESLYLINIIFNNVLVLCTCKLENNLHNNII